MTNRYSRSEKGKWTDDRLPFRKPLVKISATDNTDLIERNRFTLIGRVTNPSIQKTRALVDFFLQQWSVVGRITGRDLGPALFQFGFESEQDLQTILSKAPFHFKKWMLILQRWEPIVSDSFPSAISFWVKVHGVPLHYWSEKTFEPIGDALGTIEARDFDRARMRIRINGLKPLIMRMDIELPSKKILEVELEYEKLEKHCFFCKSLSHEDDDCELRPSARHERDRRPTDIAQQNTLDRIDESKRRQEARRQARQHQGPSRDGARWTNYRLSESRDVYRQSRDRQSREDSSRVPARSSEFEENKRKYVDRGGSFRSNLSPRRSSPRREDRENQGRETHEAYTPRANSQPRQLPAPAITAKPLLSHTGEASSKSNRSPAVELEPVQRRTSTASRLSDPREKNPHSEERISARDRLSVNTQRTSQAGRTDSNPNSKNLHDVEIQEFEDTLALPTVNSNTRPSSSKVFDSGRLGPCERSPIRTLSEDRVHVSLRLGPLLLSEEEESEDQQLELMSLSKAAEKKKVGVSQTRKRTGTSPMQGHSMKR